MSHNMETVSVQVVSQYPFLSWLAVQAKLSNYRSLLAIFNTVVEHSMMYIIKNIHPILIQINAIITSLQLYQFVSNLAVIIFTNYNFIFITLLFIVQTLNQSIVFNATQECNCYIMHYVTFSHIDSYLSFCCTNPVQEEGCHNTNVVECRFLSTGKMKNFSLTVDLCTKKEKRNKDVTQRRQSGTIQSELIVYSEFSSKYYEK